MGDEHYSPESDKVLLWQQESVCSAGVPPAKHPVAGGTPAVQLAMPRRAVTIGPPPTPRPDNAGFYKNCRLFLVIL